jgi:hypothetical protein
MAKISTFFRRAMMITVIARWGHNVLLAALALLSVLIVILAR